MYSEFPLNMFFSESSNSFQKLKKNLKYLSLDMSSEALILENKVNEQHSTQIIFLQGYENHGGPFQIQLYFKVNQVPYELFPVFFWSHHMNASSFVPIVLGTSCITKMSVNFFYV